MSDRVNLSVPIVEVDASRIPVPGARMFMMNGCSIIVSHDGPEIGWHISIARKDRDPSWNEIATARYRLLPDVEEMSMALPPFDEYVNIHGHCFHLQEVKRSRILLA